MALEISFTRTASQENGDIVLTDNTGLYDVDSNDTGYGTPNLSRADVNIVPWVSYGYSEESLSPVAYSPDSSEVIYIPNNGDGVYGIRVYALPISYDYSDSDEQDLIDNSVSSVDLGECIIDVFATRKWYSYYELLRDDKCKHEKNYRDIMAYIRLETIAAKVDLANDTGTEAHTKLTELTKYISKSRI